MGHMKRLSVICILVAALSSFVMAEESKSSGDFYNRGASGGFWAMQDDISSGYGEWSFAFVDDSNGFVLRDCINMGGFGMNDNVHQNYAGGMIMGDKLLIGGRYTLTDVVIRTYGIVGGHFGMFAGTNHEFFNPPFMAGCLVGGGFELQYTLKSAFAVEFGGSYTTVFGKNYKDYQQFSKMGPILMLGYRSYFGN